jgi:hypothetical protein
VFFTSKQHSASSYFASKRTLESKWENYKYKMLLQPDKKAVSKKKESAQKTPKKSSFFSSHRLKQDIPLLGKWNITPLLHAKKEQLSLVEKITELLLIELYGHTAFWKAAEKKVPHLAKALVKSFQNKEKVTTLLDLFPTEEVLQEPFYKMLKGSGSYKILSKEGYPPLEDFFSLLEQEKKTSHMAHASYPILKAIFEENTLEQILALEKRKWEESSYPRSVKKEELFQICKENSLRLPGVRFQDIEPLFHFSQKYARLDKLTVHNEQNHIHLQIPLP